MSTTTNETATTTTKKATAATTVSPKALEILLERARQMQADSVRAAYGAYRVHDRSK